MGPVYMVEINELNIIICYAFIAKLDGMMDANKLH